MSRDDSSRSGDRAGIAAQVSRTLGKRYRAERRFQLYGIVAITLAMLFLGFLFASIISRGVSAFQATYVNLDVSFDQEAIDPERKRDPDLLRQADYRGIVRKSMQEFFPEASGRKDRRALLALISNGVEFQLRDMVLDNPDLIGTRQSVWVLASAEMDTVVKGAVDLDLDESDRRLSDKQVGWISELEKEGRVDLRFNRVLFTNGDSRDPEQAGLRVALLGSLYTLLVTLALSFPIGVAAAVYLEEFAPKNRWTDLIEVNINNLAAVPSIVFGLLGLAVFINLFGMPRSVPLVGGLVLTLMTLPTIIIASRAALKSVPPSIREAALGIGASPTQTVTHHVLPLAMPGMLTGTIIGMAQALGETAPLLMIGMIAFIVDPPTAVTDPATVLPVQIYLWADSPERGFVAKTSAAIMVLLGFLILMNALAVILRKRFERRW
jgi:phosphate transport system permease protein